MNPKERLFQVKNMGTIDESLTTDPIIQASHGPPEPPKMIGIGFESDDIEDLGGRIASLSRNEARKLTEYLKRKHNL